MIDVIPKAGVNSPPGLYFVEIIGGTYNNALKMISIKVKVIEGPDDYKSPMSLSFYVPSTQWLFNKMCLACGLDNRTQPIHIFPTKKHKGIVGNKVFMAMRILMKLYNDGEIISETIEPFEFYRESENKPAIIGDPSKNNGIPSGPFIKELVYSQNGDDAEYNEMPIPESLNDE